MPDRKRARLKSLTIDRIDGVDRGANPGADVVLVKRDDTGNSEDFDKAAPMKTVNGVKFPKEAFAYTPSDNPSSWKLRMWKNPQTKLDAGLVGGCVAALGPKGFRGNKVQIPKQDLPGVKAKVRAAWKKLHPDKKPSDIPSVLKRLEGLGAVFDKAMGVGQTMPVTTKAILDQDRLEDSYEEVTEAFKRSINRIMYWPDIPGDMVTLLKQSVKEYGDLLTALTAAGGKKDTDDVEKSEVNPDEITEALLQALAGGLDTFKQAVAEFDGDTSGDNPGLGGSESQHHQKGETMPTLQDVLKGLSDEERAIVEAEFAAKSADSASGGETENASVQTIDKSKLPPEAAAAIEKMEATVAKGAAQVEELTKQLAAEVDARKQREFTEKAKEFAVIEDPSTMAPDLRKLEELDPELAKRMNDRLRKGIDVRKAHDTLLKEIGRADEATGGAETPMGVIKAKAQEYRKAHPEVSIEQAMDHVVSTDPDVAAAYAESQPS